MDDMLGESIESMLFDLCKPALVREVEREPAKARALWQQLEESGFLDALVPEIHGGTGLPLEAASDMLIAFGRHAVPLPAAHTVLARALLAEANVENVPRGPIAMALSDMTSAEPVLVPFGRVCDAILLQSKDGVQLFEIASARLEKTGDGKSLAAIANLDQGAGKMISAAPDAVLSLGALASSATLAGAMSRAFDIALQHANERIQFGRPISKFQVVQHQLSAMAEQVAASRVAVEIGMRKHESATKELLARAIAKARSSRAAPLVASYAHAILGALGITAEFDLQIFTRRLYEERMQFGSEAYWEGLIGAHALAGWTAVVPGMLDALAE